MIDASSAIQKLIVSRLAAANVLPATRIYDGMRKPEVFPCIIVGEGQTIYPDYDSNFYITQNTDLHVWTKTDDLYSVKAIAVAIRSALFNAPWTVDGHTCVNLRVEHSRFMRDPDGIHSHGIVSVTAYLQESVQLHLGVAQ